MAKMNPGSTETTAEAQVDSFIAKFDADHQELIRSVRRVLQERFPTATELIYDNYNFFVIGYCPTDRPSHSILSIAAGASGVGLCFIHGASLPDPAGILLGSGKQTRFIRVDSANVLADPRVRTLIDRAEAQAEVPFRPGGRGAVVIRSISAKQRPRRRSPK